MIRLGGIRKAYLDGGRRHEVLAGVDLEMGEGDFVAILGASGSGKSTLLNIVGGLDCDFEGEARVDGLSLRGLDDRSLSRFRAQSVGFVFQSFHLIADLSTLDNVALPGWFSGQEDEEVRERAEEVLSAVDLSSKAHRRPERLSGGERQRVAIARALFHRPKILLCDEPTGNLDSRTGQEVIDLFGDLNRQGVTLLMVTHEARIAEAAGRLLRLHEGLLSEVEASSTSVTSVTGEAKT